MKHFIVLVLLVCGVNNTNSQILSGSNNLSLDPSNITIDVTSNNSSSITTKKTKDAQKSMTKEDSPVTMKQVGDGYHCTVHLEKAGKLKSMIKDEDAVFDILHDSYIKAFSHLDSFEGGDRFTAWVRQIAANTARDWMKKKTAVYKVPDSD